MLNSGNKFRACVVRKKILNETINHNLPPPPPPPFKLNGQSLIYIYIEQLLD